jgi:DNA polymerase III alpha subunit
MWTKENSEKELIEGILKHGPKILEHCVCSDDLSLYLNRIYAEKLDYPVPVEINYNNWFIPTEYKKLDIKKFLIDQCPEENISRLEEELALYKKHNMLSVLTAMKYIVDTLRANGVVWGVGRGSSVASYALHLLGVHKIDSVKYNIPIEEFFKGE